MAFREPSDAKRRIDRRKAYAGSSSCQDDDASDDGSGNDQSRPDGEGTSENGHERRNRRDAQRLLPGK